VIDKFLSSDTNKKMTTWFVTRQQCHTMLIISSTAAIGYSYVKIKNLKVVASKSNIEYYKV